ncbi:MAG: TlpA family protein disulfide reductase [Bacteroidales bacterium]|nr:TlpA family protein disulfide reductase [Bacteroidales bacterium]
MKRIVFVVLCGLVSFAGYGQSASSQEDMLRQIYEQTTYLKEGAVAADFTADRYAGGKVKLSDYKGKVVLLNFWATWCNPCLRELAPEALPKALEQFIDNEDFVYLPVAYTDSRKTLDDFFSSPKGQSYLYLSAKVILDTDKRIFSKYAEKSIPRSFVIGRDGRIVLGSLGSSPEEIEKISEAVGNALKQEKPSH